MNLKEITQQYYTLFPADLSGNTMQRQTPGVLLAAVEIEKFQTPELILFNEKLAEEIGLGKIDDEQDTMFLNAAYVPQHLKTYATAYAGHQFGNWAGQLGDGRAIFAGEIANKNGKKNRTPVERRRRYSLLPTCRRPRGASVLSPRISDE